MKCEDCGPDFRRTSAANQSFWSSLLVTSGVLLWTARIGALKLTGTTAGSVEWRQADSSGADFDRWRQPPHFSDPPLLGPILIYGRRPSISIPFKTRPFPNGPSHSNLFDSYLIKSAISFHHAILWKPKETPVKLVSEVISHPHLSHWLSPRISDIFQEHENKKLSSFFPFAAEKDHTTSSYLNLAELIADKLHCIIRSNDFAFSTWSYKPLSTKWKLVSMSFSVILH